MSFTNWDTLNNEIRNQTLQWNQVRTRVLRIVQDIDALRRTDRIEEGTYRQKGNRFRDTLRALIHAQCDLDMPNRRVDGRTDRHDIDLTLLENGQLTVAVEAKMIGSPIHVRRGVGYGERSIGIDIDKRIKEMKYTAIDLKRLTRPENIGQWSDWRNTTSPRFAAALMMRLAGRNRVDAIKEKLEGLAEYLDAVGVVLYREDEEGTLSWVPIQSSSVMDIGKLTTAICNWLE